LHMPPEIPPPKTIAEMYLATKITSTQ